MNWGTATFGAAFIGLLAAACSSYALAAPPADLPQHVDRLIEKLSDDRFGVREEARRELISLTADAATHDEVRRLLMPRTTDSALPFEVRSVLKGLVPTPTARDTAAVAKPMADAVQWDAWIAQLDASSFERREQAAAQLLKAAQRSETAGPLLWHMAARLSKELPPADSLQRLLNTWDAALQVWVTTKPAAWQPPRVDDAAIEQRLDRLAAEHLDATRPERLQMPAVIERELTLWATDDEICARMVAALKRRTESPVFTPAILARYSRLYNQIRPAMSAEFWRDGRHHAVQHLLIGVPNQPEHAPRPSLFDRCDDQVAHCVSGNSLAPGDHPVGVFFPHPSDMQAQFHLVNLPTARRRLAYGFDVPTSSVSPEALAKIDARRKREITQRTIARLVQSKQPLEERQITMLSSLDAAETARFAAKYLLTVDDAPQESGSPQAFGNGSMHGWLCYVLSTLKVPEAGEAIAVAIDKKRILPPTDSKPFRIEWVAVFRLAQSAPWPGVDEWLAKQIERTDAIDLREPKAAEVGATAAALLLQRHDRNPADFSLEPREFVELIDLETPCFRFTKPEARAAVQAWWLERKDAMAKEKSP